MDQVDQVAVRIPKEKQTISLGFVRFSGKCHALRFQLLVRAIEIGDGNGNVP